MRGLSIIIILKYIMRNLNHARGVDLDPWEEFDMIGGTSTGGIIAIMLGRLRMSLDECEKAYKEISREIFKTPNRRDADPRRIYDFLMANNKFSPEPLETSVRTILDRKELPENELLKDTHSQACKVFVCTTRALDSTPATLRSYFSPKHDPYYDDCDIMKAVRATSAASTFFPEIELGEYDEPFVDGAFRRNNPIHVANVESLNIWPNEHRMFISIGTGEAPGRDLPGNLFSLADRLKDIVTDSQLADADFQAANRQLVRDGNFYRLNVDDGSMAEIGLEEYLKAREIAGRTNTYLQKPRIEESVTNCVNQMLEGGQRMGWANREGES